MFDFEALGVHDDGVGAGAIVQINVDDVRDMDSKIYSQVMGRWRRDSIAALRSMDFWANLFIAS